MSEHLDALKRMIDKTMVGDFEGASHELHPDLLIIEPPGLPHSGQWHGRAASATVKKIIIDHWDQDMGSIRYWDCENAVFSHRNIEWRSKTTGKSVWSEVVELFEFQDGMIKQITVYIMDTIGLAATLVT